MAQACWRTEELHAVADRAQGLPGLLQQRLLPLGGNEQGASRRQQRMLGKPCGRALQEGAAGHGQGADLRGSVAFGKQGGRSPGRVIARLRFTFEHDDATAGGEMPGNGCAGNAAADDEEVGLFRWRKLGHRAIL
jgi:hypothetical protein